MAVDVADDAQDDDALDDSVAEDTPQATPGAPTGLATAGTRVTESPVAAPGAAATASDAQGEERGGTDGTAAHVADAVTSTGLGAVPEASDPRRTFNSLAGRHHPPPLTRLLPLACATILPFRQTFGRPADSVSWMVFDSPSVNDAK